MNTKEYVKLNSDTNYIPVKYIVMEVSIGNSLAASYAWLKCVSSGVDTVPHYNDIKEDYKLSENRPTSVGVVGIIGSYTVAALSTVSTYSSPASLEYSNLLIG